MWLLVDWWPFLMASGTVVCVCVPAFLAIHIQRSQARNAPVRAINQPVARIYMRRHAKSDTAPRHDLQEESRTAPHLLHTEHDTHIRVIDITPIGDKEKNFDEK